MDPTFVTFAAYWRRSTLCFRAAWTNPGDKVRSLLNDVSDERNHIWYVSDGGISRIVVQLGSRTLRLDGPPSQRAKDAWETREVRAAVREAQAVLAILCTELHIPNHL